MHGFSIGQLANRAHVSIDTIRFYERAGLLTPTLRRPSGFREYSDSELQALKFIREGRLLGFSLDEIRELLALTHEPDAAGAQSRIEQALLSVDERIEQLKAWRRSLGNLTAPNRRQESNSPQEPSTCAGQAFRASAERPSSSNR
jgi:MerR family copper efflux transcriptional regulator